MIWYCNVWKNWMKIKILPSNICLLQIGRKWAAPCGGLVGQQKIWSLIRGRRKRPSADFFEQCYVVWWWAIGGGACGSIQNTKAPSFGQIILWEAEMFPPSSLFIFCTQHNAPTAPYPLTNHTNIQMISNFNRTSCWYYTTKHWLKSPLLKSREMSQNSILLCRYCQWIVNFIQIKQLFYR